MPQQPGETFEDYSARVRGKTREIAARYKKDDPGTSEPEAYQERLADAKDRYGKLVGVPYRPARFPDVEDGSGNIILSELAQIEMALLDPEAERDILREIDMRDNRAELASRHHN